MDKRHQQRITLFQQLFATDFSPQKNDSRIQPILEKLSDIDAEIQKHAPRYPLDQMAKVDVAILRLAVYELRYAPEPQPAKVVIDEAVRLAREYGKDQSYSFINGVLAAIVGETVE